MAGSSNISGYWPLSSIYLFYFALLGAIIPFWNLYLVELGYSAVEIGYLGAILTGTKILSPYLLGWLTDKTGQPVRVIRYCNFVAFVLFLGIYLVPIEASAKHGFVILAAIIAAFSFFWNAVIGQYEMLTFLSLGDQHHRYGAVRAWGSIGFILTVTALGYMLETVQISHLVDVIALLLLLNWLGSCWIKDVRREHSIDKSGDAQGFLRYFLRVDVWAFFAGCCLVKLAHGPYYTFYTIYLEDYGYSRSLIGWLWSLGVIAELGMFFVISQLMKQFSLKLILVVCAFAGIARWLLIGIAPESLTLLVLSQLLHAVNFAAWHTAAVNWVRVNFSFAHQGQAQALYSAVSFGLGSVLGALISGWIWTDERSGAWTVLWAIAAVASLLAGIAFMLVKNDSKSYQS